MRDTRYIILVLLSSLLMLTGCSRRDVLDDYPVSGVEILLDWAGVTDELPEGVRIIFYPKDGEGRKVDRYLSVQGGEMKVPPGRYSVVAYNYNTEVVRIRGEESYETIEAYTGYCNGLGIAGTEKMVWSPDPLYVLNILYDALYQIMGADSFAKNMERGLIEVAPLAYMRGRTLDNAFIILDEAQNTTPAQMKMFLTRIGFGSKVIITGDASQKDLPRDTTSGLDVAMKVLKKIDDIGFCQLTSKDVVRHPLVQQIVQAYDAYEKKQKPERPARRRNGVNER